MNLIVGATGILGSQICALLRERGQPVKALVRDTSNPDKVAQLRSIGAELARGDLKDRASLEAACRGASAIVSTASSTLSRQAGDSIESVDREGQLALVESAEAAGVKHFVYVSFSDAGVEFPLQSAKRAVEQRLQQSRMTYTILQPMCFAEVWLSPALGFDLAHATARIYGNGRNKTSWISARDVAQFSVAALDASRAANSIAKLGGPDALSPLEVVQLAEQIIGKSIAVQHVPEEALRAQYAAASDSLQQSFAALMLYYANGDVIDMTDTVRRFAVPSLRSVGDHLRASAPASAQAV